MIPTIKEFLMETQGCEYKMESIVKYGISRK